MKLQLGFICVSFLFLALFLVGLFNFLTSWEPNGCNMTFMYEYPQLVKVSLPRKANNEKYGLYVYGEGRNIHKVREMKFDGVPVLFIPGNRGSPMQVRSLASVSLSKAKHSKVPFHFDYFAVDLNEDFSALYGGYLKEQTEFVNDCLGKILALYRREGKPKSIIVIGHSMGGIIAKGLFLEPNFKRGLVQLIITLATPHQPALLTDILLANYYMSVNRFWDNFNGTENGVSLISIGGGPKDVLVKSDLTLTKHADINVITPKVPGVWESADHLCILWCNQLVLALVRSLFDSVNINTKQLNKDVYFRNKIFSYHLLERGGGKNYHTSQFPKGPELLTPDIGSQWIEMNERNMLWSGKGVPSTTHIILSLATPYDTLGVETVNHKTRDWIFACNLYPAAEGVRSCNQGINLSSDGRIAPPLDHLKRKSAIISLSQLRRQNFTHIVVRTLPTNDNVQIYLDLFKKRDRAVTGATYLNLKSVVVPRTERNASYYSVELPDMSRFWHSYRLHVEPIEGCTLRVFSRVSVSVPWSNDGTTKLMREGRTSADIFVLTGRPANKDSLTVDAQLFLDPRCSYTISLEKSLRLSLGLVVTHSGPSLIAYVSCCMLFCLAYQAKCLGADGDCPLIQLILPLAAKPYFIIQASALAASLLQSVGKVLMFIPATDINVDAGFVELIVIPFFLHLVAFSTTFILATGVVVSVVLQGQAFNTLFLRFLKRYSLGIAWLSEYILTGVSKVPIVVSAFMVTVAFSASGGLALCIGLCFYFFKMISLYEDFWEEVLYWPVRYLKWMLRQRRSGGGEDTQEARPSFEIPQISEISFHLSLILLWSVPTLISLPSVLVWAKNYKFSNRLEPDPAFYCSVVMSVCVGFLWQSELPKAGLKWSKQLGYVLIGLGLTVMVYSQTNLYRIPYLVCAAFVLVTAHQVVVPFLPLAQGDQEITTIQGEEQVICHDDGNNEELSTKEELKETPAATSKDVDEENDDSTSQTH